MIGSLITLIIVALVIGILLWLVIWIVDSIPIPDPPGRIVKIAATVVAVIMIIVLLLNFAGIDTGINVR